MAETSVSGDGTWHKRGYSSLHGIVNVISMETGTVLDTEVLTQFCKQCSLHEKDRPDEIKYCQWRAEHEPKAPCTRERIRLGLIPDWRG